MVLPLPTYSKIFSVKQCVRYHAPKLTKFVTLVPSAFTMGAKRNKLDINKNGDIEVGMI